MKPYKILLWGFGHGYNENLNSIKYQEIMGSLIIVGITGKDELYTCLDGYPVLKKSDIDKVLFDYIVITSEKYFDEICKDAVGLGIERERILSIRIFNLPGFDFRKYITLLRSNITIISNSCWGGVTYHSLGIKFYSPFINIYINSNDYLKLLDNLQYYLGCKLKFVRWEYEVNLKRNFPVCILGDVELFFNHYFTFEEVEYQWYKRCARMNWDNLFVMFFTQNEDSLSRFDALKYSKKVCFVPFKSNVDSADTITFSSNCMIKEKQWWEIVGGLSTQDYYSYDILQLLLEGKPNHTRVQGYTG